MEITIEKIKKDILHNGLLETYVQQFPKMLGFFSEFVKKPKCETCEQGLFSELSKQTDLEEKLGKVYNMPVQVSKELKEYASFIKRNMTSLVTEVFHVSKDDYAKFIEDFSKDKYIRTINTLYIQEEKEIIVTLVYNKMFL
jgi:hypothetical protein